MRQPDTTECYETTDGVQIHAQSWGKGNRGTILFVPGLGANSFQFAKDMQFFAEAGYTSIAVSLRAHGSSSAPAPLTRATLTVEKMAQDLVPLLDRYPDNSVHLVGNSLGGLVALKAAHAKTNKVASLTTFGTTFHLYFPPSIALVQYLTGKLMGSERLAKLVAKNATKHDHARALLLQMYRKVDLRAMYRIQQNIRKYDYREIAKDLPVPIMLIRSEHDADINRHLKSTLTAMTEHPQFILNELNDAGHFANLDQPDAFRTVLGNFFATMANE